jgi:hypothetical protein
MLHKDARSLSYFSKNIPHGISNCTDNRERKGNIRLVSDFLNMTTGQTDKSILYFFEEQLVA